MSIAIYAEYARESNKVMHDGLNRRVFNVKEVERGKGISLDADGSITLAPGTYRLTGFSTVTMQTAMSPPDISSGNFPGYCMLYRREDEALDEKLLPKALAIGSGATSAYLEPSTFDTVCTFEEVTHICVGHQSGGGLNGRVWLSIYQPTDGVPSEYHVVARISITRL